MKRSALRLVVPLLLGLLLLIGSQPLWAALREPIPLKIPMRDGALLAADLYTPDARRGLPVILIQTPYNKDQFAPVFAENPSRSPLFASEDYAFLIVDWRGRHGSKAARGDAVDKDGLDGYDTVEWAAKQRWCNGKIGAWGLSALGVAQYRTAETQPPHLACCVPMVAAAYCRYETLYPGGALREEHLNVLRMAGFGTGDVIVSHPTKDILWRLVARRWRPGQIQVPMLLIGGWHDIHADVTPVDFATLRDRAGKGARAHHRLLMGPWAHSRIDKLQQGELSYPEAQRVAAREALAFFDKWLRGIDPAAPPPAVRYFVMGENRWHDADAWPPRPVTQHTLYLREGRRLAEAQPSEHGGADRFAYDPSDPTPTVGGALLLEVRGLISGPCDQRERIESRRDVLVYTTDPLERDVTLLGSAKAELHVSSDRKDTDFAVRLCDVYPDGRSMLVTDGMRRARFRDSLSRPELMRPGEVYAINVRLPQTAITFLKGHRIRISVSSANYPRFSVNRNDGGDLYGEGEMLRAHNRVYREPGRASAIRLPVVRAAP